MNIKIKKLNKDAKMPYRAHLTDSGADLVATSKERDISGIWTYGTGLAIEIPPGYEGQIRPRSSISKYDLILCNSPGTIDSEYRGEIMIKFRQTDTPANVYNIGDKIAQLVIQKVDLVNFIEAEELSNTKRGTGSFGSTGA